MCHRTALLSSTAEIPGAEVQVRGGERAGGLLHSVRVVAGGEWLGPALESDHRQPLQPGRRRLLTDGRTDGLTASCGRPAHASLFIDAVILRGSALNVDG